MPAAAPPTAAPPSVAPPGPPGTPGSTATQLALRRAQGSRYVRLVAILAVLGPGLVSGFADNDAGGITTYSLAGVRFGYELLWVILASQIALFFTQEVGARLGLATGQGFTGLTREEFGVRWATFAAIVMLVANLGSTVAEFAGVGAALSIFGVPLPIAAIVAAVTVVFLISRGSYGKVQYLFVAIGFAISVAYLISAILAKPDWAHALHSLVIPQFSSSSAYWLAAVGVMGTTITPWGQAFIQAYVVDKRLNPEDLMGERLDVGLGAFITNFVAALIIVACAATLWAHGETNVSSGADVARALEPLAGTAAKYLFAVGLLGASVLGLGVVPLTSAYTACEAFGWEQGVDQTPRQAPAFYALLAFFVGFGALFVLIPGLPLLLVMFLAQVLNGVLLPFILVFVMLLAGNKRLMGELRSGRLLRLIGWVVTVAVAAMSAMLVIAWLGGAST